MKEPTEKTPYKQFDRVTWKSLIEAHILRNDDYRGSTDVQGASDKTKSRQARKSERVAYRVEKYSNHKYRTNKFFEEKSIITL